MELRFPHTLGTDEAKKRLESAAREHDMTLDWASDGSSGTIEKKAPMMGAVQASYIVREDVLEVVVIKRPKLLPEGTLRRMLEDELARLLG